MGIAEDIQRELATDSRARARAREAVLLGFKELPWQDQFKTYKVMQGYFIHSGPGSEAWREVRQRGECVEAMQRVARHLGLPEGEAPGVEAYERGRKEMGLGLSAPTIIRRWGTWREASKAARGERVAMTARQRAHFRAAIRRRPTHKEALAGVREWLSERPPTRRMVDYDAWATERNEQRPELPPAVIAGSLLPALVLPWTLILRVARGELDLARAQARHLAAHKRENGEFASLTGICLTYGISKNKAKTLVGRRGFPRHAFRLHHMRVWRWSDIEAHRAGEPFPKRAAGELQGEVTSSVEIRRLCGLPADGEHEELRRLRPSLPQPAGSVATFLYWWRSDIQRWVEENPALAPGTLRASR